MAVPDISPTAARGASGAGECPGEAADDDGGRRGDRQRLEKASEPYVGAKFGPVSSLNCSVDVRLVKLAMTLGDFENSGRVEGLGGLPDVESASAVEASSLLRRCRELGGGGRFKLRRPSPRRKASLISLYTVWNDCLPQILY